MDEKIVDALNDCLERLARGEALDAVLSRYPEARRELEPLLQASLVTRKALAGIAPPPGARARVWTHLQPAMKGRSRPRSGPLAWLRPWAVAATSLFLVFLLAGGTVLASTNSLPHQPLYAVKLAAEQAQLALTPTQEGKARLELALAEKRAREMVAVAQLNRPQELEKLADRLERHLEKVAGPALEAPASPLPSSLPLEVTEKTTEGMQALTVTPPPPSPQPQEAPALRVTATPQVTPTPEAAATAQAAPTPQVTATPEAARAPAGLPGPPPRAEGQGEDEKPGKGEPEKAAATPERAATAKAEPGPPPRAEGLGEGAKTVKPEPEKAEPDRVAKTVKPEPEKAAKTGKPDLEARLEEGARLQDELLGEHLEKVPPQAREALRQALEKNRDNYQKALKRLQEKRDEKEKD